MFSRLSEWFGWARCIALQPMEAQRTLKGINA